MKFRSILKKTAALTLSAALAAGALTACGGSQTPAAAESQDASSNAAASADLPEEATQSAELDTSDENTIYFAIESGTIRTAVVILADQLGYYEEEGVNVEFVDSQDAPTTLAAISSGKKDVDVLGTGIVPDLTFIANGSDLVVFEGTAAEGGAIISAEGEEEQYKDLKNYEGITAAMVRGSSSWVITRAKLLEEGIDVDSIELLEVDSQANVAQAVAKGEADLGFLPVEFANSFSDIGISTVMEVGELAPMYVCCRQVTSAAKLEEKEEAFVKYTKANLRALEYFEDEANQQDIVTILADFSGQTEEYVHEYFFENRTFLTLDPNKDGVEEFYQSLQDSGFFEESTDVDVSDHINVAIYKQALDEIAAEYPDDAFYQEQLQIFEEYN